MKLKPELKAALAVVAVFGSSYVGAKLMLLLGPQVMLWIGLAVLAYVVYSVALTVFQRAEKIEEWKINKK
jgi:type III secretory pathway component EscU